MRTLISRVRKTFWVIQKRKLKANSQSVEGELYRIIQIHIQAQIARQRRRGTRKEGRRFGRKEEEKKQPNQEGNSSSPGRRTVSHSLMPNSLQSHGLQLARLLSPWNSPGNSTGMGSHSLLQGIFPTERSNLGLLHYRQMLYHLSYQVSSISLSLLIIRAFWTRKHFRDH